MASKHFAKVAFLGPPPVKKTQLNDYYRLFDFLWESCEPVDPIQYILIRDFVDETFVGAWMRQQQRTLAPKLAKHATELTEEEYAVPGVITTELRYRLALRQVYTEFLRRYEKADQLLARCMKRRSDALRQMEKRRSSPTNRVRETSARVEDRAKPVQRVRIHIPEEAAPVGKQKKPAAA